MTINKHLQKQGYALHALIMLKRFRMSDHCTMGQAVEINILEVHKSKQILHAYL